MFVWALDSHGTALDLQLQSNGSCLINESSSKTLLMSPLPDESGSVAHSLLSFYRKPPFFSVASPFLRPKKRPSHSVMSHSHRKWPFVSCSIKPIKRFIRRSAAVVRRQTHLKQWRLWPRQCASPLSEAENGATNYVTALFDLPGGECRPKAYGSVCPLFEVLCVCWRECSIAGCFAAVCWLPSMSQRRVRAALEVQRNPAKGRLGGLPYRTTFEVSAVVHALSLPGMQRWMLATCCRSLKTLVMRRESDISSCIDRKSKLLAESQTAGTVRHTWSRYLLVFSYHREDKLDSFQTKMGVYQI